MNIETEKKFLVKDDKYKAQAVKSYRIRQGYLAHDSGRTVRVRIRDNQGFLTIKGPSLIPGSRPEWEKEISLQEAEDLFVLCKPGSVDKTRWIVPAEMPGQAGHDGRYFEVDEFHGENDGLVMAEIELSRPGNPGFFVSLHQRMVLRPGVFPASSIGKPVGIRNCARSCVVQNGSESMPLKRLPVMPAMTDSSRRPGPGPVRRPAIVQLHNRARGQVRVGT